MKMKVIETSLKNAADWEKKGQPPWVERCLSMAIMNYLSIAVCEYDEQPGVAWLKAQSIQTQLVRYGGALAAVMSMVESGKVPSSVIGGNYNFLVFSHVAWLLGEYQLGSALAGVAGRPDVASVSTPLWREYSRAITELVRGNTYTSVPLKRLRGLELHWQQYLRLVEAATQGENLQEALLALDQSLEARNADYGIKDDLYQIEGSGMQAVRWDFRRSGLLAYIDHIKQL